MLKTNPYIKAYLNTINEDVNKASVKKYQQIANDIGGVYNFEINSIDCKGNTIRFKNSWLNDKGSFDFKLINTSNDWGYMFKECNQLKYLPQDFIIPDHVDMCYDMFYNCESLTHLPESFIIPQHVIDCSFMFGNCKSLTHLPDIFTIPNSVVNCSGMFFNCRSLTHLPDNFIISNNVVDVTGMFKNCIKLTSLPEQFTLPPNVSKCQFMFWGCKSLINLPLHFNVPINCRFDNMFYKCTKLQNKNPENYVMIEI